MSDPLGMSCWSVPWPTWMGEVDGGLPRCLQPADDDVVFGQ